MHFELHYNATCTISKIKYARAAPCYHVLLKFVEKCAPFRKKERIYCNKEKAKDIVALDGV